MYKIEGRIINGKSTIGYIVNKTAVTIRDIKDMAANGIIHGLYYNKDNDGLYFYGISGTLERVEQEEPWFILHLIDIGIINGPLYWAGTDKNGNSIVNSSLYRKAYSYEDIKFLASKGLIFNTKYYKSLDSIISEDTNIQNLKYIPNIRLEELKIPISKLKDRDKITGVSKKSYKVVGAIFESKFKVLCGYMVRDKNELDSTTYNLSLGAIKQLIMEKKLSKFIEIQDVEEYKRVTGKQPKNKTLPISLKGDGPSYVNAIIPIVRLNSKMTEVEANYLFNGNIKYIDYNWDVECINGIIDAKTLESIKNRINQQPTDIELVIDNNSKLTILGRYGYRGNRNTEKVLVSDTDCMIELDGYICSIRHNMRNRLARIFGQTVIQEIKSAPVIPAMLCKAPNIDFIGMIKDDNKEKYVMQIL